MNDRIPSPAEFAARYPRPETQYVAEILVAAQTTPVTPAIPKPSAIAALYRPVIESTQALNHRIQASLEQRPLRKPARRRTGWHPSDKSKRVWRRGLRTIY